MTRTATKDEEMKALRKIIAKMETLNDLWWKSEGEHNQAALKEHNRLVQEIRTDMAEIGMDF